jgi:hypothetical protein
LSSIYRLLSISIYIWVYLQILTTTQPVERQSQNLTKSYLFLLHLVASWWLGYRASPPDLGLLFAKVLRELGLNFGTCEFGHGLRALDRAGAISPSTGEDDIHLF